MQRIRFRFDPAHGATFDGFDTGTRWNGFLNVKVTPSERERMARDLIDTDPDCPEQHDAAAELRAVPVGPDGLVDLSNEGFTLIPDED